MSDAQEQQQQQQQQQQEQQQEAPSTLDASASAAPVRKERGSRKVKRSATSAGDAENEKVTFNAKKDGDFALWYEQICVVADLIDKRYPVKGMPVFRPYGFFMHNRIMRMVEDEWEALGTFPAQFPTVIPYSLLAREEEHVRGFEKECFWVTHGGLEPLPEKLALRPTSETAMYTMFSLWVRSHRDLPLQVHQTCTVFRHETKDTRPLIRVREIPWNEAHTCHASHDEALAHLEDAWRGYLHVIHDQLCITGLRLQRPEWDKFAGSEHTHVMDSLMPCGRVLQVVGAHYLGQKFAKVFDITFLNKAQKKEHAYMTCYGVSTRLMAAMISAHGDDNGLVLPDNVAQFQVVAVGLTSKTVDVAGTLGKLVADMRRDGLRVTVDDSDKKPGEKYYFWEMKGVPVRIELGARDVENGVATIVPRMPIFDERKITVPFDQVVAKVREVLKIQSDTLRKRAFDHLASHVFDCATLDDIRDAIGKRGIARIPFVSKGLNKQQAEPLLEKLGEGGGEIRGFRPDEAAPPAGSVCALSGEPATVYAYIARSY